jgi:acetolactate synthase I/II/III large subunit
MAQGYARATGCPGVVVVQAGYPAMNLVTPLVDAWMDSTPLVCLVVHQGDDLDGCRPRLSELARPIAKRSWIAPSAGELLDAMTAALREATTGRWRPVVVERPPPRSAATWAGRASPRTTVAGSSTSIAQL